MPRRIGARPPYGYLQQKETKCEHGHPRIQTVHQTACRATEQLSEVLDPEATLERTLIEISGHRERHADQQDRENPPVDGLVKYIPHHCTDSSHHNSGNPTRNSTGFGLVRRKRLKKGPRRTEASTYYLRSGVGRYHHQNDDERVQIASRGCQRRYETPPTEKGQSHHRRHEQPGQSRQRPSLHILAVHKATRFNQHDCDCWRNNGDENGRTVHREQCYDESPQSQAYSHLLVTADPFHDHLQVRVVEFLR